MDILKKYETLSIKYKQYHSTACEYYSSWNTKLNILNIVIVSLISIANNITSTINSGNKMLQVCYSIVLYFSVLLSTLQQFLKYEELSEKHRVTSIRYNHLYSLCQLSTEQDAASIIEEYENIYNNAPNVPEHLKQKEQEEVKVFGAVKIDESIDIATAHQLNRMIVQSYKV